MKKQMRLLLVTVILAFAIAPTSYAASQDVVNYYLTGVAFSSKIGDPGFNYLPTSYDDLGISTVVISAAGNYNASYNEGYERGRIWSRPENVKPWFKDSAFTVVNEVRTTRAVMQFSSSYKDGVLWIDGSDPAQSSDNKITIPGYIYNLAGLSAYGAPINAAVSLIDGFTSSAIKLSFPDNDRQKHYIEYYDSNGLANMALPNSYTYSQADYASNQKYMGASPRWKYSMVGGPRTNYSVTMVGRVAYEASVYDSGYYYDNYGWTTLATVNHQVNRQ